MRPIRVAVVGGGPAGIYAADILTREYEGASVDVIERLPAPYGLVRYGVAPDHPRIKEIIKALRRVLDNDRIRFFGNVNFGADLKLDDLKRYYDAVIFSTGAMADRDLNVPGEDLDGSYGAADFVSWYAGHPDVPRDWPLTAQSVAVLGAGNVGLDVARMLAKPADEQLVTEIADNVYQGLKANQATEVHVFARRGPAHIKFSPMELRELSHSPSVDVIVEEEGFQIDDAGQAEISGAKSVKLVVDTLLKYLEAEPTGAPHKIVIHMMQNPVEILGEDGKVVAIRTERTEYQGDGSVKGTGEFVDTPVQAVYRAIGYLSSPVADVPFDDRKGVIPNAGGRVLSEVEGEQVPGVYVTGWIKRGPVGLIGHTKSDAKETVDHLLADLDSLPAPEVTDPAGIVEHLTARGVEFTTEEGWGKLEEHERALGAAASTDELTRERVKVVPREEMIAISRA
ncbi:FAD-dependent oxidoreductase [Nocardioides sp.]|uniref:FAD-dependent oxidoreductase n=1 Tax=Nocardioides sp. TaxID=35761 RepID=UPI002627439A|nr:FAD-dependent oxidoreductase [Nocardioides sp.]